MKQVNVPLQDNDFFKTIISLNDLKDSCVVIESSIIRELIARKNATVVQLDPTREDPDDYIEVAWDEGKMSLVKIDSSQGIYYLLIFTDLLKDGTYYKTIVGGNKLYVLMKE